MQPDPQEQHPAHRLAPTTVALFAAALLLGACKGTPDEIAQCPATSDGGTGCEEVMPPPDPQGCANPEFDTSPPSATDEYMCEGQAGGHIVFRQVPVETPGGTLLGGGPGTIPGAPDPEEGPQWIPFPSMDHDVRACCDQNDPEILPDDVTGSCRRDCARATVNDILAQLREAAMESDPSDGKCDAAPMSFGGPDKCRANIVISLESFIDQIECNYEEVVAAVAGNENPDLPYWDPEFPFASSFVFPQDPDCNHGELGCFFDAELRAFCEITDETIQSSCEQAGNLPDPAADDGGCGLDETGGEGGVVDPFGDIDNSVYCSPQTDCTILQQLHYDVGYNFHVFYDEGVELVPVSIPTRGVKVTGLDNGEYSKELADAFGIQNNDVITHVNGTQLANEANTLTVIAMLDADDGPWSVTVRRWNGSSWATLSYSIEFAVSFGPRERGDDTPDVIARQEGDTSSSSSCACQTTGGGAPAPAGLAALLLGGLLRRRRRRV